MHSFRYRAVQDYLIPLAEWQRDRDRILKETDLAQYADGKKVLAQLKDALSERFARTNENICNGTNSFAKLSADGKIRVTTPRTDSSAESFISSTLGSRGIVPILDVLKSADRYCNFTKSFQHQSPKHAKIKPSPEVFMAGVMAKGCNIGIRKLARISTGLDAGPLRNAVDKCFGRGNIQAANKIVTDSIQKLALANLYVNEPDMHHSSSDGRKVSVATSSIQAAYSPKYFGQEQGVTDYTFVDERQVFFHGVVFTATDRDATHVLDGLLDNAVPHSHMHSTDTHGYTDPLFGASFLMGITFAPRLAKPHKYALYSFSSGKTHKKLGHVLTPSELVKHKVILRNWDDVLRFIATIKSHRCSASQLFKRLSSYAKQHPLYRALKEFGRILKSQYLLTYFDDVKLRQKVQKQQNLAEQAQKFAKAVFFDNEREFQEGGIEDQQEVVDCRLLLQNCIVLWNYLSLSEHVANAESKQDRMEIVAAIKTGSVMTWAHINLRGEYTFTPPSAKDPYFDIRKIRSIRI